jgi:hypothetical protein
VPVERLISRGVSAGVKPGGDGVILWEPRPGGSECAFVYDTTVVARVPADAGRDDVTVVWSHRAPVRLSASGSRLAVADLARVEHVAEFQTTVQEPRFSIDSVARAHGTSPGFRAMPHNRGSVLSNR